MDASMENAIRFISGELNANPNANRSELINEACKKFDLKPNQSEFLLNKFVLEK
ncbi:MAG: hypothetical protein JXA07_16230 [Spirochaetes bacterium]|nr:hypothetical protein [Spirochaetota bacterium]